MDKLDFILWLLLYPISTGICSYISTKEKKIRDGGYYSTGVYAMSGLVNAFIYVVVAGLLY